MAAPIFDTTVNQLATIVEEGARANARNTKRFIEPAEGTLRRATTKRHHIIFGRRGSGKSSLLFKSADTLSAEGRPIAYVDLEPYKGHHYPDLLISVLLVTFKIFREWLESAKLPSEFGRTWRTVWLRKSRTAKGRRKERLLAALDKVIRDLKDQLQFVDGAAMVSKASRGDKEAQSAMVKANVKAGMPAAGAAEVETNFNAASESTEAKEEEEKYTRSKKDYLHRKILDLRDIFQQFTALTGGDCFLFLDDLYHISRSDQPQLIDYFHRVAKGNNLWLKVGSIRHRSTWYTNAPQPIGLKIGDDADEINLDLTLETFAGSRHFLCMVLNTYIDEAKAPSLDSLLADGGLDRLVLASGGVTRDFLGLFRRAIEAAKERLTKAKDSPRGEKIGAEDVNLAAGAYGDTKKAEFQRDTLDDRERLEAAIQKIRSFCLQKTKTNIFLIDQDLTGSDYDLVQELVDLRLIHHVRSRVTVREFPGKNFRALLLDVSQYSGERKKRDVEMLEFWKDANKEELRRRLLVYDPSVSLTDLMRDIEERNKKGKAISGPDAEASLFDYGGGNSAPLPNDSET